MYLFSVEMQDMSKSVEYLSENEEDYLDDTSKLRMSMKSVDASREDGLDKDLEEKSTSDTNVAATETDLKKPHRWFESSAAEINLGSSEDIFDEKTRSLSRDAVTRKVIGARLANSESRKLLSNGNPSATDQKDIKKTENKKDSFGAKVVRFFDLGLLKDPIFVNIMLGISLAACAEINFALLTPFILNDLNFTTPQIAAVMSVIAFSDIIFRFLSPFISERCHKSERVMYIISLIFLICTRTSEYKTLEISRFICCQHILTIWRLV